VAVLLFHVQAFVYLGIALPLLLLTTPAPEDASSAGRPWGERLPALLKTRAAALAGVVPGVALFLLWVVARLGAPTEIAPGQPWHAWGPMLSAQNLSYKTREQNWAELGQMLENILRDRSDRYCLWAVALVVAVGVIIALVVPEARAGRTEGSVARWRMLGLAAIALVLYFTLPFDIRGYMYYLNTRYAHLAAPLVVASVPALTARWGRLLLIGGAAATLILAVPLFRGFAEFNEEARALDALAPAAGSRPIVMGLIFNPSSRVVNHPVFLHAATVLAREEGGATNFSFALTPHSPLKYRGEPPPTFPSEWHPEQFNYARMGSAYDTFLGRGMPPERVFGDLLQSQLTVAAQQDTFWLVKRR
jgi:hypothetical protein